MYSLANDDSKTIVLLINDFNPEFGVATEKLEKYLGRKLTGVVLVDADVRKNDLHKPITDSRFEEIICDFNDPQSIENALKPYKENLLVVNSSSEKNQPFFQLVIPHISNIYVPTVKSIELSTHKDLMRDAFIKYNPTLSPKSTILTRQNYKQELIKFKNFDFPLISKPTGLAASILVKKSNSFEELVTNITESFERIETTYKRNRGRGKPCMLVEEFIDGEMFSVDAYVNNEGLIWCLPPVKVTTAAALGFEGYYSYKRNIEHDLNDEEIKKCNKTAIASVKALGLKNSVAHIELFKTNNGWRIIEAGPRAGGYRQDMYWLSYGIDHALNELLVKLGFEPTIHTKIKKSSAALNIYCETEGIISSITGFDEAVKFDGIFRLVLHAKPSDRAILCGNGGNYIVDGVVFGDDKSKTEELMLKIRSTIQIKVS